MNRLPGKLHDCYVNVFTCRTFRNQSINQSISLYLPLAVFIAERLVGLSKQPKQIIQIEHAIVKIPNWLEAKQFAFYRHGQGFELGATEKQIQVVVRVELKPATTKLQV